MKNKKSYLYFLIGLLILCVTGLSYWYIFKDKNTTKVEDDFPLKTDLAVLYFVEPQTDFGKIKLGVDFYDGINKGKYKISELSTELFDENNLSEIVNNTQLPSYVSINVENGKYIIEKKNSEAINDVLLRDFNNNINDITLNIESSKQTAPFFLRYWILAENYKKTIGKDANDFAKLYFNSIMVPFEGEKKKDIIFTDGMTKDNDYPMNYSMNYPYSCFSSKQIAKSGVTEINYDDVFCNLPTIESIPVESFGVENIESILTKNNGDIIDSKDIYSTTLLIDYLAKGESNLDDVYRYSLSQVYKLGLTKGDYCYWMLVNDLTKYKNNLYVYAIHNEAIFNQFSNMYCPSLHMPIQYKYLDNASALDTAYFIYDL